MALPVYDGKYLVDLAAAKLGGYANAIDPNLLLLLVNEGKDEVWAILKDLRADYFEKSSQYSSPSDDDYFGPFSSTTREYNLPADFHEMKFIEAVTSGHEIDLFRHRDMATQEFGDARRGATMGAGFFSSSVYHYDIIGKRTMILAEYPEQGLQVRIWYVRWIPDLEMDTVLDEVLHPYAKRITDYAVKKVMLTDGEAQLWQAWKDEWTESVKRLEKSAGPRQIAEPVFVEDFIG